MTRLTSAANNAHNAERRTDDRHNSAYTAQATPAKAKQTSTRSDIQNRAAKRDGSISCRRTHHGAVASASARTKAMQDTSATNRHAVFTAYCASGSESLGI